MNNKTILWTIISILALTLTAAGALAINTNNVVNYWEVNQVSPNLADYQQRNNMTQTGNTLSVNGGKRYNGTIIEQGTTDTAYINFSAPLNQDWTFIDWINKTSSGGGFSDLLGQDSTGATEYWHIRENGANFELEIQNGGGATATFPKGLLPLGKYTMLSVTYKNSTSNWTIYINGTQVASVIKAWNAVSAIRFGIGRMIDTGAESYGAMHDEMSFHNETLNAGNITEWWNASAGSFPPFTQPVVNVPGITLIVPANGTVQYYNNPIVPAVANASYFGGEVNITARLYNSTGGLINTTTTAANLSISYNLTSGQYWLNATATNNTHTAYSDNRTFYIYNITPGGIKTPTAGQQVATQFLNITINASTTTPTSAGITISSYNYTLINSTGSVLKSLQVSTNLSVYWNIYAENLSIGNYTIVLRIQDSQGNNATSNQTFSLLTNAFLNISIKNAVNGALITDNTSLNATNLLTGYKTIFNISGGTINLDIAKNANYTFFVDSPGYAYTSANLTTGNSSQQYLNITLFTNNSISINIYDETTGARIYENITITFSSNNVSLTRYTNTSQLYIDNLADGNYTINFYSANYSLKTYTVTVAFRSTQNLDAYLANNPLPVVMTALDFDSSAVLVGATATQYVQVNGTWTLIDAKTTDITGRVQFYYLPTSSYQFLFSLTGYNNNLFYLNPVLFSSYNVRLQRITTLTPPNTPDYTGVSITFYNTTFYDGQNNTIIWTISSPVGALSSYNLTIRYPGGSFFDSGSNAIGEQFNTTFLLTGSNYTDRVNISYCYETSTSYNRCFSYAYSIIGTYANTSFAALKDNTYGLGLFDRILLVTFFVLAVAGIIWGLGGGALGGGLAALLIMGFFVKTGFIPIWSVLPSMFVGAILIFSGGKK